VLRRLPRSLRHRLERLSEFKGKTGIDVSEYALELFKFSRQIVKEEKLKKAVKIFSALSDPVRIKILKMLKKRRMCVCELMTALNMKQPVVSYHLKLLKEGGLIKPVRRGKWVFYEAAKNDVLKLIDEIISKA